MNPSRVVYLQNSARFHLNRLQKNQLCLVVIGALSLSIYLISLTSNQVKKLCYSLFPQVEEVAFWKLEFLFWLIQCLSNVFVIFGKWQIFRWKNTFEFWHWNKCFSKFFLKNISTKEWKLSTKNITAWRPLFVDLR